MTKMINWRLATIRLWVFSIAFCGISLANVSCTSAEDEPSGQKEVYEINDYYMERTAMLNIWYVYFALTGSPLSTEALENLKQNSYYAKGELLVEAYQ